MKTVCTFNDVKVKPFPKLMYNRDKLLKLKVILMSSPGRGLVVHAEDGCIELDNIMKNINYLLLSRELRFPCVEY